MKSMEKAFSDIVSDSIGYARRMHKNVQDTASDAGKECALWVRENLLTTNYDRIKAMIKEEKTNPIFGGNTEEFNLARSIATRQWRHVEHWAVNSEDEREMEESDSPPIADLDEANVVTSENRYYEKIKEMNPGYDHVHLPVLDLDCNHSYVPSTTPGHGHLLLDVALTQDQFENLLTTLANCGILDHGYVNAAIQRGYSAVRLPWVKKEIAPVAPDPWADIPEDPEPETEELRDGIGNLITTESVVPEWTI